MCARLPAPPFIHSRDHTASVMADVVIALLPCIFMSWLAYGYVPLMVVLVAVGSALAAEFFFSLLATGQTDSLSNGSAIVTGILLALTLAPFTPLYAAAFGSAMAVIFGKLLLGGLGKNMFNPALVGRECMTVFFPLVMASGNIWHNAEAVNVGSLPFFGEIFLDELFFRPSGAIGEYSVFFLVLGGVYLLARRRISWHIPFGFCVMLTGFSLFFPGDPLRFSPGGVLLGAVYMATDMPTSSSTPWGKLYFGVMTGMVAAIFLTSDVRFEYMSYAILLMNAFVRPVNRVFRPRVWGTALGFYRRFWQGVLLTGGILAVCLILIGLHRLGMVAYLVLVYLTFSLIRFLVVQTKQWHRQKTAGEG
ncbi:MAG: RnfABCDGE type electron transport complex subunit D [Oxalobacter formigenes]|nr:RnfABCDGE type electron transport complex subunit D [Oxalobacter formigenes]